MKKEMVTKMARYTIGNTICGGIILFLFGSGLWMQERKKVTLWGDYFRLIDKEAPLKTFQVQLGIMLTHFSYFQGVQIKSPIHDVSQYF